MNLEDEFIQFFGKIVAVECDFHRIPIYGKVVALSPIFLSLERRDGRITVVRRKEIRLIKAMKNQQKE